MFALSVEMSTQCPRADRKDGVIDGGAKGVLYRLDLGQRNLREGHPTVWRDGSVERGAGRGQRCATLRSAAAPLKGDLDDGSGGGWEQLGQGKGTAKT